MKPPVPYSLPYVAPQEMVARLEDEFRLLDTRRSVRMFSQAEVPRAAIEAAIRCASTAPSGAHRQPWHFVAVSDPALKAKIRAAAEAEERDFYERRAPADWLEALAPLGTDFVKAHITDAPWLIVVFRQDWSVGELGQKLKNYYMTESVGMAVGFLIQALHRAGLATLTHTPAPMTFLREACGRPANEKPFVLMPVGYPAPGCTVPDLARKPLGEVSTFI